MENNKSLKGNCVICFYFDEFEEDEDQIVANGYGYSGYCRYNPPAIVIVNNKPFSLISEVRALDWCSKFQKSC
jgi:hypothetical protein